MDIVNIVAIGDLNAESLDIEQLYQDLTSTERSLKGGRLDVRVGEDPTLVMVYPAGTYTIPGAPSKPKLNQTRQHFLKHLSESSEGEITEETFSIKYMVFKSDIGESLDLELLAIHLGMECIEYEPEQFPGLIYRPDSTEGVALIFATGKILFTGFQSRQKAKQVENSLLEMMSDVSI